MGFNLWLISQTKALAHGNEEQNKKKNDREMDLVILKQRSGMTEVNIPMTYHAKFNYFEELGTYE